MNRRSVIRSILGLAVAPKILAEIDFKPMASKAVTASLFQDLQFVIPDYLPKLIEKYGNTSWAEFNSIQFINYEKKKETI